MADEQPHPKKQAVGNSPGISSSAGDLDVVRDIADHKRLGVPLVLVGDRFQIEGRTFERVASKEAKCKADKCTTQGGHVFAGYGYNGVQLKQHALACLRAEVASSAKDSKRQKLQEEKTASKARKAENELSQWTGEPAWPSWLQRRFE